MAGSIAQGFVLVPVGEGLDASEVASSLSFVFGVITNELIELCIPHNILFSDRGNRIYIIVREFSNPKALFGWLEFCGVYPVEGEAGFGVKEEEILEMKRGLRVEKKLIETLKKNVGRHLDNYI